MIETRIIYRVFCDRCQHEFGPLTCGFDDKSDAEKWLASVEGQEELKTISGKHYCLKCVNKGLAEWMKESA